MLNGPQALFMSPQSTPLPPCTHSMSCGVHTRIYLCLVSDVDLSEQGAGEGENVIERFVPEGAGHLAVLGQRPHGLCLVHLQHQLVQDLHSHHTVVH